MPISVGACGVAFGVGLGDVTGKAFRIGHPGSLPDAMTFSGLATAETVMIPKSPEVFRGRRVGVIITGGDVDLDKLPWSRGRGPWTT